jgi:hypothetical protein
MAVPPSTRRIVRERAQRHCEYGHADERRQFVRVIIDHVLPQLAGGSENAENFALACRNCNERRGNRVEGRDPETETVVSLFNPRRMRLCFSTARFCGSPVEKRCVGHDGTPHKNLSDVCGFDGAHLGEIHKKCDVGYGACDRDASRYFRRPVAGHKTPGGIYAVHVRSLTPAVCRAFTTVSQAGSGKKTLSYKLLFTNSGNIPAQNVVTKIEGYLNNPSCDLLDIHELLRSHKG